MPLFALSLASLYFLPASLAVYYAAWIVFMVFGVVLWTGPYNKVVAAWFDRRLGLALGLSNSGQGLGTAFIQPFALLLIVSFGWRWAYVGMGLLMIVPFLFNLTLLYDNPRDRELLPDGAPVTAEATARAASVAAGYSVRESMRYPIFWLILVAFLLIGCLAAFVATGQVPMLIDSGLSPAKAASVASVFGLGIVAGRMSVGWLIDHFFAPHVMMVSMLCPVVGLVMYATGHAGNSAYIWSILIGLGIGAENDLLGFSIARYFGRKAYGKLYGIYIGSFQLGVGSAAVALGAVRTAYGSYTPGLFAIAGGIVVVILLCTRMGPYVFRVQTVHP
jgi:cyanate permease